ncbi:TlpA family protein disulfide reductase [Actomonas aquatica]|uniref:Thioredoxin domain-containing protein n=1 Tax=Actomonas aquatica TaxID=2866162 RepID=A0ABZ1CDY1_9BACT|nr:hypothetical protein [Opitutus sp. WL0086]WRQ89892.1 hypothetical protein K1X11_010785 [Opitutus sp. WL0086]
MPVSTLPRPLAALLSLICCVSGVAAAETSGPIVVADAQRLDLDAYVEPGKTVVFGFVSKFSPACPCEPCANLADPMAALQAAHDDMVVVMVQIDREGATQIDWTSPVAMQFGLRRLPHFMVVGPEGKVLVEDNPQESGTEALEWVHHRIEALPGHTVTPVKVAGGSS